MSARGALVNATAVAALVVGLLFLWHGRDVLLLVFGGVLFGIFLRRLAMLLSSHTRLPTSAALALVLLGIIGIFVTAFWLRGDRIAAESPGCVRICRRRWSSFERRLRRMTWASA